MADEMKRATMRKHVDVDKTPRERLRLLIRAARAAFKRADREVQHDQ